MARFWKSAWKTRHDISVVQSDTSQMEICRRCLPEECAAACAACADSAACADWESAGTISAFQIYWEDMEQRYRISFLMAQELCQSKTDLIIATMFGKNRILSNGQCKWSILYFSESGCHEKYQAVKAAKSAICKKRIHWKRERCHSVTEDFNRPLRRISIDKYIEHKLQIVLEVGTAYFAKSLHTDGAAITCL